MKQTQKNKNYAGHKGCNGKSLKSVESYDIVDDNNKSPGRAANLNRASAKSRYHETAHNGGDETYCRADARCYTESNCQRQCYNADYNAGYKIILKFSR